MALGRLLLPLLLVSAVAPSEAGAAEAFLGSPVGTGPGGPRGLSNATDLTRAWTVYNVRSSTWGNSVGRVAYFDDSTRPGFKFSGGAKAVMVDQYRDGKKIRSGGALLWKGTSYMVGSCSPRKCTAMARFVANHGSYQWRHGDMIHVQTWEAEEKKKSSGSDSNKDDLSGKPLNLLLVIVLIIVVYCCVFGCYFLYRRRKHRIKAGDDFREAEEPTEDAPLTVGPTGKVEDAPEQPEARSPWLHDTLYPSRWCVTPEQFFAFMQQVHHRFPDRDPSVQEVVDALVKPATESTGTSYALCFNREGVPCKHFVTHAWQAGAKQLGQSVYDADPSGGIWIDFLAIPQTLPKAEMAELMGQDLWKSPCAKAMTMCSDVIHVHNPMCHLLSRLWCVFELFLAHELEKPVTVVGCEGEAPEYPSKAMGLSATCTNPEDLAALRAALDPRKESVNAWLEEVGMVVAADL